MRQYDLSMPILLRAAPFAVLALITVGIVLTPALGKGPPWFVVIPFLIAVSWNWWVLLSLAYRINVHPDGTIEWVALVRNVRMRPEAIKEIRPEGSGSIGFFRVIHSGGKIRFVNQITGFHEVVAHIKSQNATVVLKGC